MIAYLALMLLSFGVCGVLLLIPSTRYLATRLGLATLGSLPGLLFFQIAVGIPLAILLLAVLGFYAAFHPAEWVRWMIGIPTIVVMFASFAAASFMGAYTGGGIGWLVAAGTPVSEAVSEQKIVRYVIARFRRASSK